MLEAHGIYHRSQWTYRDMLEAYGMYHWSQWTYRDMLEAYGMYHWSQWTYRVQGYTGNPRYVSLEPVNVQGTGIYWKPTVCITGASEHTGYRDILEAHGMYRWSQ